jgi:hypothetical protein
LVFGISGFYVGLGIVASGLRQGTMKSQSADRESEIRKAAHEFSRR